MDRATALKFIDSIKAHLNSRYSHYYMLHDGTVVRGLRPADVNKHLIDSGWRNVSRLDERDYKKLGFGTAIAEYIGGARVTGKFCPIVVNHTCCFRFTRVDGGWVLEGTDFLDGFYKDIWGALDAIRRVGHG